MYSQSIKSEWNDRQSKAKHGIPWMLKKSCFGFHWHYVQLNSGSVSVQDNYTDSDVCRFVWCCSRIQISLAAIETSKWSEFLTHTHCALRTYTIMRRVIIIFFTEMNDFLEHSEIEKFILTSEYQSSTNRTECLYVCSVLVFIMLYGHINFVSFYKFIINKSRYTYVFHILKEMRNSNRIKSYIIRLSCDLRLGTLYTKQNSIQ